MSGCSCHSTKEIKTVQEKKQYITNLLIGAPNVGKSTFFNRITWQHSPVGNIDKVTVSSNLGSFKGDKNIKFLDLPGVYNLNPITKEEEIVIDNILNKKYDKIVNIVSITSMRRDLLLTIELLESNRLSNLVVNMIDEWQNKNLNSFTLINKLGVPTSLI
ncbi:MAG: 50S ribosome-binding GTPase, partial [Ureaplasma sp.]|nr:50S ribosome-binding GTPase [Ureaplasma sp.]